MCLVTGNFGTIFSFPQHCLFKSDEPMGWCLRRKELAIYFHSLFLKDWGWTTQIVLRGGLLCLYGLSDIKALVYSWIPSLKLTTDLQIGSMYSKPLILVLAMILHCLPYNKTASKQDFQFLNTVYVESNLAAFSA